MSKGNLIVVGGGVRSGKSNFALKFAEANYSRKTFLATAEAYDDEMRERILRHKYERGDSWITIEEPVEVAKSLGKIEETDIVLLDCLTLWVSNMIMAEKSDDKIFAEINSLLDVLGEKDFDLIIVTNEVGMGIVPEASLGRRFRDLIGLIHQNLCTRADQVFFALMGQIIKIKPSSLNVAL